MAWMTNLVVYVNRRLLGQQRDKLYREALRLELAAAGEDLKKLREIARVHIEKAAGGDMQAIKELADRLDGKPAMGRTWIGQVAFLRGPLRRGAR